MHRFFIPSELFVHPEIILPNEISRQISRVLRLKTGSEVLLLDNRGFEYLSVLHAVDDQGCTATVRTKHPAGGEPATRLTLILGLTQREKFELILQKCTEVGASIIVPVITSRTLVQKAGDASDKSERWNKILSEAAEQSHRGRIPQLSPVMKYTDALTSLQTDEVLKLILWEEESGNDIKQALRSFKGSNVVLIIGPEGGLTSEEVTLAQLHGFKAVSLGKRILRMETAAILAAGLVVYELG